MTRSARGTGPRATEAELDHAIDVVARQMTEGSPSGRADFRRRVLARIAAGHAPRANWRAAWVLSPLAAAAAIVMAIVVARGPQPRDGASIEQRREGAAPHETATVAESAAPPPLTVVTEQLQVRLKPDTTVPVDGPDTTVRAVTVRAATNRAGTNRAAAAPGQPFGTEAIEALAAPSLDLVPLAIDALAPDSIQLERLDTISPITVAPIDITDVQRRDE